MEAGKTMNGMKRELFELVGSAALAGPAERAALIDIVGIVKPVGLVVLVAVPGPIGLVRSVPRVGLLIALIQ